jgi:hypothetical protein
LETAFSFQFAPLVCQNNTLITFINIKVFQKKCVVKKCVPQYQKQKKENRQYNLRNERIRIAIPQDNTE